MQILLIQGANMESLGQRKPGWYGTTTVAELDALLVAAAAERGLTLDIFYTNLEGATISRIYQAVRDGVDGLMMNPAVFLYPGYALKDCLKSIPLPYIEVHLTNIDKREKISITVAESDGMITGLGVRSCVLALDAVAGVIGDRRAAGLIAARARASARLDDT